MYTPVPNVPIVGQNFTAPAVVPPTLTTPQEAFAAYINKVANCSASEWNAPSFLKLPNAI